MANQIILSRLRSQTQRAGGFQKCPPFDTKSKEWDHTKHFGRNEVAYETPLYSDVGQIIFLGGPKETAALDFYLHSYTEFLDPELYKLRENSAKRQRIPHANEPRAELYRFYYDIIEHSTGLVVGEIVTRRFRFPGSRSGNNWALVSITFQGHQTQLLPPGAI